MASDPAGREGGEPPQVAVALGANLGDALATLRQARAELPSRLARWGCVGFSWSRVWRTAPVGPPQPDYLNAVVAFQVGGLLEPTDLLAVLQGLEAGAGRQRQVRWGPRTLDLDVILWGLRVVAQPGLSVPHPRAHLRGFVLWPLLDVWPGAVIPGWGDARVLARGLGLEGCAPVLDQGAWAPVAAPTPTFTSRS